MPPPGPPGEEGEGRVEPTNPWWTWGQPSLGEFQLGEENWRRELTLP